MNLRGIYDHQLQLIMMDTGETLRPLLPANAAEALDSDGVLAEALTDWAIERGTIGDGELIAVAA